MSYEVPKVNRPVSRDLHIVLVRRRSTDSKVLVISTDPRAGAESGTFADYVNRLVRGPATVVESRSRPWPWVAGAGQEEAAYHLADRLCTAASAAWPRSLGAALWRTLHLDMRLRFLDEAVSVVDAVHGLIDDTAPDEVVLDVAPRRSPRYFDIGPRFDRERLIEAAVRGALDDSDRITVVDTWRYRLRRAVMRCFVPRPISLLPGVKVRHLPAPLARWAARVERIRDGRCARRPISPEPCCGARTALFLLFVQHQTKVIRPVMDQLSRQGWHVACLTVGCAQGDELRAAGYETIPVDVSVGRAGTDPVRRVRALLGQSWQQMCRDPSVRRAFEYRGAELFPVLAADMRQCATEIMERVVTRYRAYELLLGEVRPNVVVLSNEGNEAGKALALAARKHGVPVVTLQHGTVILPYPWMPIDGDRMAVWGDTAVEVFTGIGVAREKLAVAGAPWFDGARIVPERTDAGSAVLLLTCLNAFDISPMTLRQIAEAVGSIPGSRLLIRPHPGEPASLYKRQIKGCSGTARVLPAESLDESLARARVVLSHNSTAIIDAAMAGRGVILLPSPCANKFESAAKDGIVTVDTPAELADAVRVLADHNGAYTDHGQRVPRALRCHLDEVGSRSAERVAQVVMALAGENGCEANG